ncbi:uncharacterized protein LOC114828525 [Galendromus occidentalis]|uniref:Uncharacterized protein LOC114828525 n=1 Tax=Galendromus occidentalis TaxID=34638 RepID=A0AAJ7SHP5_9ACAR|nr:uncharacterized protein LOC114828525 [Galendromus occidentalis]
MTSPGKALHSRSVPDSPKRSPTVTNKRRQLIQDSMNRLLMDIMLAQPEQPLKFIEEYFSHPEDSLERHVVCLKALNPLRISNVFIFHKTFHSLCSPDANYLRCEVLVDLVDRCLSDCDFSLQTLLSTKPKFLGHAISFRVFHLVLYECLCYRHFKNYVDKLDSNAASSKPNPESLWTSIEEMIPCQHKSEMRDAVLQSSSIRLPYQAAEVYRSEILEKYVSSLLVENERF